MSWCGAKLEKLRILPSGICSDPVFLRRVTIDITGKLSTEEDYRAFVADTAPDKRARLIDRLGKKAFAEIWAMKWAEMLMIRTTHQVSYKSAYLYANWLADRISRNVPVNRMVHELLGATGGTFRNPATNYYQVETDTLKTAENVAQQFMGIRVQWRTATTTPSTVGPWTTITASRHFFAQIGRKQGEDYRETIVFNRGRGEVTHPVGGRVMQPKFLGGSKPDVSRQRSPRSVGRVAHLSDNPFFAPSLAIECGRISSASALWNRWTTFA